MTSSVYFSEACLTHWRNFRTRVWYFLLEHILKVGQLGGSWAFSGFFFLSKVHIPALHSHECVGNYISTCRYFPCNCTKFHWRSLFFSFSSFIFGDFVLNLNIVTTLNIGNNKALSYVILANSLEERPLGNC